MRGFLFSAGKQGDRNSLRVSILISACFLQLFKFGAIDYVHADALGDFAATGADDALVDLADLYAKKSGSRAVAAAAILREFASRGSVRAMSALGEINLDRSSDMVTRAKGLAQLVQAAEQNDGAAAAVLAFHFLYSEKPEQDYAKGQKYAQQAADAGLRQGFYALAMISAFGWGVKQDPQLAAQYMSQAADLGDANAFQDLAQYYHAGFGVEQNDVIAYAWATLAVMRDGKLPYATQLQDDLALILLPEQALLGRKLAATWKPGDDLAARVKAEQGASEILPPDDGVIISAPGPVYGEKYKRAKINDIGIVERKYTDDAIVQPDGTLTSTWHIELEARNEAAVKDLGQIPIRYDNAIEEINIQEAYTLKADGRKISVDPNSILTEQAPDSQDNIMFDDRRRKVLIFSNVEVGDVVAYTVHHKVKPLIPGLLSMGTSFDPTSQESDVNFSITAPKSLPLYIETHGAVMNKSAEGDDIIYRLRYANRRPLAEMHSDFDELDVMPRVSVTNFKDYRQFVDAYSPLVAPKVVVTPQVQALADKLTVGITDRRQQAKVIYEWVSRHIRYVGVEYGIGGIVPHEADNILTNGYGDCKDHSVVFAALLKAKGIRADLVLINGGWRMSLFLFPRISNFDHMITYLPEFDLYADTTAEVAPFGILPFKEYGKPVVHVPLDKQGSDAVVVRRIPVLKPDVATITMKTVAHLQSDGRIIGDSETVATGPFSIKVRYGAMSIQSDGAAKIATKLLSDDGFDGKGTFDFASPYDPAPSYRLAGHFETDAYDGLLHGNQFELPRGLLDGWSPGSWLMGWIGFKGEKDVPTFCWSGHEIEELSLELPAGTHLARLPTGRTIESKYMRFRSTWSTTGQTVMVRREFTSKIDAPICLGWARGDMASDLPQIRNDLNTRISVVPN